MEEEDDDDEPEFLPKNTFDKKLNESVNKTLDWFKKFEKYN